MTSFTVNAISLLSQPFGSKHVLIVADSDVQYISDHWFIFVPRKLCVLDILTDPNDVFTVYLEVLCVGRQKANLYSDVGVLFTIASVLFVLLKYLIGIVT